MSLSADLTSPSKKITRQEQRKILQEYGFLYSKETEMSLSDVVPKPSQTSTMQEDSRKCHQGSSFLRLKEPEMFFPGVSPMNRDEEAFLNGGHCSCSFLEALNCSESNLFDGNQSYFSLDFGLNMNSQRSPGLKMIPKPRFLKTSNNNNNGLSVESSNNSSGYGTKITIGTYTQITNLPDFQSIFATSSSLSHEQQLKQQKQRFIGHDAFDQNHVAYDMVNPFEPFELSLFPNQYQNNAEEDHQILHFTSQSNMASEQQQEDSTEPNWTMKRVLTKSDVGFGGGKLFLQKKSFEKHILKHLPEEDKQKIVSNKPGIIVQVYDHDTGTTHNLRMAFLKCYVLMGHWWKQFVKRRELKEGDKIGLFWECSTSKLHFRVLSRAIPKAPEET